MIVTVTPNPVLEKLARLREECQLDSLRCALSHDTFEQFTEHVLPHLQN